MAQRPEHDDLGTRYPKGAHDVVAPEEREALGLNEAGWTRGDAKVHPDVYRALEKTEKVKEAWRDPIGYAGTVYVQVQLKHAQKGKADSPENKAAIKQLQDKVLSQLTAAEFYVEYAFQTLPGILAYVNRAGLEKLTANPDVVAVCLDDKPFPKRSPHVYKADLPALKPGDPSTQPAQGHFWGNGGKVEAAVYQALGLHERVFVMVKLISTASDQPLSREEAAHNKDVENAVLSSMSAAEFCLQSRTTSFPSIHGLVSKSALKKLEDHPNVEVVGMPDAMIPVPTDTGRRP
jgi:hypothetical protein